MEIIYAYVDEVAYYPHINFFSISTKIIIKMNLKKA